MNLILWSSIIVVIYAVVGVMSYLIINPRTNVDVGDPGPQPLPSPTTDVATLQMIGPGRYYIKDTDVTIVRGTTPFFSVRAICADHRDPATCNEIYQGMDTNAIGHDSSGNRYYLYGAGVVSET